MATKTTCELICNCGHKGQITMTESSSRFSRTWREYSIRGFKGASSGIDGWPTFEQALAKVKAKCPDCGKVIDRSDMRMAVS